MIDNVEHFDPELDIEILGDSPDVIVLEHREVETGNSGTDQDIATSVAAEVEAHQGRYAASRPPRIVRIRDCAESRRVGVAIGVPERQIRSGRKLEALSSADIVGGVPGIDAASTSGTAEAIRISKIVTTIGVCRIVASAPRRGKGDAVAEGQNRSELPTLGNPLSRAGPRFRRRQFPRCIENKTAAHIIIREAPS